MTGARRMWVVATIIMWILVVLCPLYILPVCTPDLFNAGRISHGCTGTMFANTITGIFGVAVAVAALKKSFFKISTMLTAVSGLLIVLIPTVITGVCRVSTMRCVWGTRPGLIVGGITLMAAGLAGLMLANKST